MRARAGDTRPDAVALSAAFAVIDGASDLALLVVDSRLVIRQAIGGLLRAAHWPVGDLRGRTVTDLVCAGEAAELRAHCRAALDGSRRQIASRDALGLRYRLDLVPWQDGTQSRAVILWRADGADRGAGVAGDDAQDRYQLVADGVADVVSLESLAGRILWISPSVRDVLGYGPAQLVGSHAHDLAHPDDVDLVRERGVSRHGAAHGVRSTWRALHADGSYRWIERSERCVRDPRNREIVTVVASARDMTERVVSERALRDSQIRVHAVLDTMTEAAVLYDAEGAVIARNPLSLQLLGGDDRLLRLGTADSVAGWRDPRGTPLICELHPGMLARLASGPLTIVVSLPAPAGARRWVRATASAVDAPDACGWVVMTLCDITSLHELGVDLARSNEDLRRMALVAAHDLGVPLAALRLELEAAAESGDLADAATIRLGRAADAADMMQEALGAVMAHARVEGAVVSREKIDVVALEEETLAILGAQIDEAGAVVAFDELPEISGDRLLVRRLLQILIQNAIVHHGGPPARIRVRAQSRGPETVFVVEDDGTGVAEGERAHAFELFGRGAGLPAGYGIGLATARRIVELHGGRIWIEDADPHGARLCFTLARRADE